MRATTAIAMPSQLANASRRQAGESETNASTIITSRVLVRHLTRQRLNECFPTEERFRKSDAASQMLLEQLKRNLSGLRLLDRSWARKLSRRLA